MRKRKEQIALPLLCFLLVTGPLQAADKDERQTTGIPLEQLQEQLRQQTKRHQ
jgi:hypothetical protein